MRWEDEFGVIWASRFECEVFSGVSGQLRAGGSVRKCTEADQLDYSSVVKNAQCQECNSGKVVQRRVFTPDLFVVPAPAAGGKHEPRGYFVETKGYLRGHQRNLLRHVIKCNPDLDLRFIIEKDYRATRTLSLGQWIDKYLKRPWIVWAGTLPEAWK